MDLFASTNTSAWYTRLPFFKPYPGFNLEQFTTYRAEYVARLKSGARVSPSELADPVKKLAFFEAVSQIRGLDVFKFGEIVDRMTPSQVTALHRSLQQFAIDEQTNWTKAQRALVKMYLVTHYNPNTKGFWDTLKTPFTQSDRELILHRVQLSLVKNSYMAALEDIGIVRSPDAVARIRERFRGAERAIRIAGSTALNVATLWIPFFNPNMPNALGTAPNLRRELENRYVREGWVSLELDIYRHYGRSARVQTWINKAERVLGVIIVPIIVFYLWDEIWETSETLWRVFLESEEAANERRWREDDVTLSASQREAIINKTLSQFLEVLLTTAKPYDATPAETEKVRKELWQGPQIAALRGNLESLTNKELVALTTPPAPAP